MEPSRNIFWEENDQKCSKVKVKRYKRCEPRSGFSDLTSAHCVGSASQKALILLICSLVVPCGERHGVDIHRVRVLLTHHFYAGLYLIASLDSTATMGDRAAGARPRQGKGVYTCLVKDT